MTKTIEKKTPITDRILKRYDMIFHKVEKTVIYQILEKFGRDNASLLAAGIAYYAMLSLFPLIMVAFAIFGVYLKREDIFQQIITYIGSIIPQAVVVIEENLEILVRSSRINTFIGIVGLMWSSNKIFCSIENALHHIWKVKEGRQFIIHKARATVLVVPLVTLLYFTMLTTSLIQTIANLPIPLFGIQLSDLPLIWGFVRFAVSFSLSIMFFYLAYRIIPKNKIRRTHLFYGALFSAGLFEATKAVFYLFLNRIIKSFSLYGSLTAILIMVFWIYLSAMIFLLGGEIVYFCSNRKNHKKSLNPAK